MKKYENNMKKTYENNMTIEKNMKIIFKKKHMFFIFFLYSPKVGFLISYFRNSSDSSFFRK